MEIMQHTEPSPQVDQGSNETPQQESTQEPQENDVSSVSNDGAPKPLGKKGQPRTVQRVKQPIRVQARRHRGTKSKGSLLSVLHLNNRVAKRPAIRRLVLMSGKTRMSSGAVRVLRAFVTGAVYAISKSACELAKARKQQTITPQDVRYVVPKVLDTKFYG